jgi:hypothetical protein
MALYGATPPLANIPNEGRTPAEIRSDFSNIYGIAATLSSGALTMTQISNKISANKPILAVISWSGGGAHAVVVAGYDTSLNAVRIYDPLSNGAGISSPALSTFTSNYQSGGATGQWAASVTLN